MIGKCIYSALLCSVRWQDLHALRLGEVDADYYGEVAAEASLLSDDLTAAPSKEDAAAAEYEDYSEDDTPSEVEKVLADASAFMKNHKLSVTALNEVAGEKLFVETASGKLQAASNEEESAEEKDEAGKESEALLQGLQQGGSDDPDKDAKEAEEAKKKKEKEAEEKKKEAEEKKKDAEEKQKKEAETREKKAEEKKKELEKKIEELDKKEKEADKKISAAEKDEQEADKKMADVDKAKKEADDKRAEADRLRAEADNKKADLERQRREAEVSLDKKRVEELVPKIADADQDIKKADDKKADAEKDAKKAIEKNTESEKAKREADDKLAKAKKEKTDAENKEKALTAGGPEAPDSRGPPIAPAQEQGCQKAEGPAASPGAAPQEVQELKQRVEDLEEVVAVLLNNEAVKEPNGTAAQTIKDLREGKASGAIAKLAAASR